MILSGLQVMPMRYVGNHFVDIHFLSQFLTKPLSMMILVSRPL